ncbi:MAG: molecular chaperone HtpG [Deltaproteobacteria bacterium]|nr:molecular chaperone HtpG [Deltaproteobacteria bacterium]
MADTLPFQAEVKQLLDLVVHSLYSDREIFLRELVSNASDAIDRARILGLTRNDLVVAEGEPAIEIEVDRDRGVLVVRDNGIGMTREQAVEHLGTIARSGTRAFAQSLKEKGDSADGLIGQFGVGFYASFMVASRVEVHTRSAEPGAEPVIWTSDGGGEFSVEPGSRATRGTAVTLHLRSDCHEYLDGWKIKDIVKKHSGFVAYPVKFDGEQLNEPQALWMRSPSEVSDDDYKAFYKQGLGEWDEPSSWVHFRAEAPLEYQAVLFFPSRKPYDLDYPDGKRGVRLYQRRVLIAEASDQFLPRYLRFVKGVIDAPEVSLNVSREILQNTPVLRSIKNQVVKRVLRRLREIAREDVATYTPFWEAFGGTLKEGVAEDRDNHDNLVPLLRFRTTAGEDWRELAQVKADMKDGQKEIGYLTGLDLGRLRNSPQLERWKKKGWEVLLLSDPVDEWVVMNLNEFDGVKLVSVAQGDVEADDDPIAEEARKQAEPFTAWARELLGELVAGVRPSKRLTDSPAVLVDEGNVSANLERILRAARQDGPKARRVLEVNPEHALVKKLVAMHAAGDTAGAEPLARLLYDYAQLAEGHVDDVSGLSQRLSALMLRVAGG